MKKTLITLLALAGVSMGTTPYTGGDINAWLDACQSDMGGNAYSLTITLGKINYDISKGDPFFQIRPSITSTVEGVETTAPIWYLRHQDGRYIGFSEGSTGINDSYTSRSETGDSSIDLDLLNGGQGDYSGWIYDSGTNKTGLSGLTFEIYSSGNDGTNISIIAGGRTITLQRNGHSDYGDLGFTSDFSGMAIESATLQRLNGSKDNVTATYSYADYAVPEPTTATLSLLALCGLAARRRRK